MDAKRRMEIEAMLDFSGDKPVIITGDLWRNITVELLDALDEAEHAREVARRILIKNVEFSQTVAEKHGLHIPPGQDWIYDTMIALSNELDRLRESAEKWLKLERDLMNIKIEVRDDPQQRTIEILQKENDRLRAELARGQWTGD